MRRKNGLWGWLPRIGLLWLCCVVAACYDPELEASLPTRVPIYTPDVETVPRTVPVSATLAVPSPSPFPTVEPTAVAVSPTATVNTPISATLAIRTSSTGTTSAQVAAGEALYNLQCARCHEQDRGIGIRLRKGILVAHGTPARLFRYLQKRMPYDTDFRLADDEYWAITAYLLVRSDLIAAEPALDPVRAEEIRLQR